MTNKILLTVGVPMIDAEYDIFIPVSKNIKIATDLIVKTVHELSNGYFPLRNDCILIDSKGEVLSKRKTVKECNLKNGDKIVMI